MASGSTNKISKAEKGKPGYDEWLRKYRQKRQSKQNNEEDNEHVRNVSSSTRELLFADRGYKQIQSALSSAGEGLEACFRTIVEGSRANQSDNAGTSRVNSSELSRQVHTLVENFGDQIVDVSSLDDNYEHLQECQGAESLLYIGEDETGEAFVIKAVDFTVQSETPSDFILNRIAIHNLLFPETAYQYHGFSLPSEGDNSIRFVLSQNFVAGEEPTQSEITEFMNDMGFIKLKTSEYKRGPVIISDLSTKNAIKGLDGHIYVIDPVISIANA